MSYRLDFRAIQKLHPKGFRKKKITKRKGFFNLLGKRDKGFFTLFGMVRRGRSQLRSHGLIIGDTGSGKNLLGDPWLAHALANRKPDDLFIMFDPKGTTAQLLEGLKVPYHIVSIDDKRGLGLDITKDCRSPKDLYEAVKAINPGSSAKQDFWSKFGLAVTLGIGTAALDIGYRAPLLATICRVLQMPPQVKRVTTLPDGTTVEEEEDFIYTFLGHSKDNARLVKVLQSGESLRAGSMAEMLASLQRLSPAGTHDAQVQDRISMREYVRGESLIDGEPVRVLIFNMDIRSRQSSEAYFRLAFQLLASNLTALPNCVDDPNHAKKFIYIDELPFISASGLPGLEPLLSVARSKGVHCLCILQSVNQMYDCYGKEKGQAIFNSLPNVVFTATGSAENARFAAEKAGQVYVNETKLSSSEGERGKNYTTAQTKELRYIQPTGALLSLPYPTKERGLYFYQIDPDSKGESSAPIEGHWSGDLVNEMKPPLDTSVPGLILREPSYYYMPQLSEVEREHLVTGVSPLFDGIVQGGPALPDLSDNPIVADVVEVLQGDVSRVIEGEKPVLKEMFTTVLSSILDEYQAGLDSYMQATYGTSGR